MAELSMSPDELACVYCAAILADDDIPVTAEKITTLLTAAGVEAEPIWPSLYARALTGVNIRELITNIGGRGAAPVDAAAAGGADAGQAEAEVKKAAPEPDTDSEDDDMGLNLFD